VLLEAERQAGQVEVGVAPAGLGPVEHAGDLVALDEHVGDLEVAVHEHGGPRSQRGLGSLAVPGDQVRRKDVVRQEPRAFAVEARCLLAEAALRPWTPVFSHGDLQITHVFVDDDEVTGVIDWSEACQGDALFDLATLTLAHEEHLGDIVAGYGTDVDLDVIRAWWSLRCLLNVRWLVEHGFGPLEEMPEVAVLRSRL
jgi:aminoglycoside phosphotransferase (APT) family kinase protein